MRKCSKCKRPTRSNRFVRAQCRDCFNAKMREWRKKNPEKVARYGKIWQARNPDKVGRWAREHPRKRKEIGRKHHLKKYGLTLEDYRIILKGQRGKCAICRKYENKRCRRLSVDHCHKTNRVRGILCINCNRGIVLIDAGLLKKALRYLDRATSK